MPFGCFVDIYQQDGTPVRMHYEGTNVDIRSAVTWIGIMEETTRKFLPSRKIMVDPACNIDLHRNNETE